MDSTYYNSIAVPKPSIIAIVTVEIYPTGSGSGNAGVQKVVVNGTSAGCNISDATDLGEIVSHVESVLRKNNSLYTKLELVTYNGLTKDGEFVTHTVATECESFRTIPLGIIRSVFESGINTKQITMHFSKPV